MTSKCDPSLLAKDSTSLRSLRCYIMPYGEDWREALRPEYWHNVTNRLQVGDRIEVHSHDHTVQFFVVVLGSNDRGIVRCDIGFAPLYPPNLELPAPIVRDARYATRYNGSRWLVEETSTREVLGEFQGQNEAREAIAALEMRDQLAEKQAAPAKSQRERAASPRSAAA